VVDKETGHTGEFVRLDRNDLDQQFFVGKVSAGQLESLGEIGLIDVDDGPFGATLATRYRQRPYILRRGPANGLDR
jgi:hypothetical protein